MARAGAASLVLAFAVCCLLVAPAPARLPVDLPRQLPDAMDDREAAAEKLLPMPVQLADAEAADQATAIAVTAIAVQESPVPVERPQHRSSLLCLIFRCGGGEPADAGRVAVARGELQALDGSAQPAAAGASEEVHRAYDSASDWDSDSDSDEEDEGGILGWFRSLADGF